MSVFKNSTVTKPTGPTTTNIKTALPAGNASLSPSASFVSAPVKGAGTPSKPKPR